MYYVICVWGVYSMCGTYVLCMYSVIPGWVLYVICSAHEYGSICVVCRTYKSVFGCCVYVLGYMCVCVACAFAVCVVSGIEPRVSHV